MVRALVLLAVAFITPRPVFAQTQSILHIKIVLADADGKTTPVPNHALLISDNPATSAPRLVKTAVDGTAEVRLRPGNYTIESDRPVTFRGKAYQWTQTLDVAAGREATLLLTANNAEVVTAGSSDTSPSTPPLEADPAFLLPRWQDSVVELWTPTAHASAFVVDAKGLVATNQKAVGTATTADVQLTSTVKVSARVLAADANRDVAILWIDPQAIASVKPIPLGCTQQAPAVPDAQQIFAIGVQYRQPKDITSGTMSDLVMPDGSDGGPVFTAEGTLVGITSTANRGDDGKRGRTRVRRAADACEVLAAAEKKVANATAPSGAHLPMEPDWPIPEEAFKDAAQHRVGNMSPYQVASQSFDVSFITPVMIFGSRYQAEQLSRRNQGGRPTRVEPMLVTRLLDFGNWSDYLEDVLPVLLVRVTPRMVEGFWQSVARGAAYTQGAALPAFKKAKSGFGRLVAYCGDNEVKPIHPFLLEQQTPTGDTITEGLYVFDPGAFGPQCATVKMVLYSEKEPEKAETRVVEPGVVQRITQDFALYKQ